MPITTTGPATDRVLVLIEWVKKLGLGWEVRDMLKDYRIALKMPIA